MNSNRTPLAALCAALLVAVVPAVAQDTKPSKPARPGVARPEDRASPQQLLEQLGAERLVERRAAEDALRARGSEVRKLLEDAAADHSDPEVRWRARRVLRALDDSGPKLQRPEPPAPTDAPRPDAPDQDRRRLPRFDGLRQFQDLEQQMEELQRRMEEFHGGFPGGFPGIVPFDGRGTSSSTRIEMGPKGVRVEVEEPKEGGGTETKTYEAEDLDSLRSQYPEVAKQFFLDGRGFGLPGFGRDGFPGLDKLEPAPLRPFIGRGGDPFVVPSPTVNQPPAEGERLGVYVGELEDAVRRFLDIEGDLGLLVESIETGSLAAKLGIRPKDVVLRIGDRPIRDAGDVRAALGAIEEGSEVRVAINRRGEVLDLKGSKDAAAVRARRLEKVEPPEAVEKAPAKPARRR